MRTKWIRLKWFNAYVYKTNFVAFVKSERKTNQSIINDNQVTACLALFSITYGPYGMQFQNYIRHAFEFLFTEQSAPIEFNSSKQVTISYHCMPLSSMRSVCSLTKCVFRKWKRHINRISLITWFFYFEKRKTS